MRAPELFYSPSPRDIASASLNLLRYQFYLEQTAATAAVLIQTEVVPKDKVLLITACGVSTNAGAGQLTVQMGAMVIDPGGLIQSEVFNVRRLAAEQQDSDGLHVSRELLLMPDERLQLYATFDAGAVANQVNGSIQGYMFQRGNIQHAPT